MFLFPKKLKHPACPNAPQARPPKRAPGACAASSTSSKSIRLRQIAQAIHIRPECRHSEREESLSFAMSFLRLHRPEHMVGFSRLQISTNTGSAPQWITAAAVATKVRDGTSTSSPGPMPSAFSARNSAVVPLETATASRVPAKRANSFSNASVRAPAVIHSESMVSSRTDSSRSSNSSSDSRAFHIGFKKGMLHFREVVIGALIIVRTADVHPVGVAFVSQHALLVFQQRLNKIGKIELL